MLVGCMNITRIFLCGLASILLAITWILLTYLTVPVIISHQKVTSVDGLWSTNQLGIKCSCVTSVVHREINMFINYTSNVLRSVWMKSKHIFILTNIEMPTRSHIISLGIRKDKTLRCYRRSNAGKM